MTGGGSGIGRAIAKRFAASGASVRILDLNLKDAEETVQYVAKNIAGWPRRSPAM